MTLKEMTARILYSKARLGPELAMFFRAAGNFKIENELKQNNFRHR